MTFASQERIRPYASLELRAIYEKFRKILDDNILDVLKPSKFDKSTTLVENIQVPTVEIEKTCKSIVLDLGGSFFKIAEVSLTYKNGKIDSKIDEVVNYQYPEKEKNSKKFWYDYVANQYLEYLVANDIVPDFTCLIFSYPIKYKKNKAASPINLTKNWCFETKKTLKSDLLKDLNDTILRRLREPNYNRVFKNYSENLMVNSILNDSVATFLSSKVVAEGQTIGIILGTGTNGAFEIEYENKTYIYNSEWGAFSLKNKLLLKEEKTYLKNLKDKHNQLDVLIGNGYKCALLNQFIASNNLDMPKLTETCVGKIMELMQTHPKRQMMSDLIYRSRQLMSTLVCATISVRQYQHVTILLNGSGYSDIEERYKFLVMMKNYAKNLFGLSTKIEIYYKDGLTFLGAAYYAFAKDFASKPQ